MNGLVSELALFDAAGAAAVAEDVAGANTPVAVTAHDGADAIEAALRGAALVIICAAVPRQPGMSVEEAFRINAGIVKALTAAVARVCPEVRTCLRACEQAAGGGQHCDENETLLGLAEGLRRAPQPCRVVSVCSHT